MSRSIIPIVEGYRKTIISLVIGVFSFIFIPKATAHSGSIHAGIPHWILLGVFLGGITIVGVSVLYSRVLPSPDQRLFLFGLFSGMFLVIVSLIGLVEIQIEPLTTNATPIPRDWYPLIAFTVGIGIIILSVGLGILKWSSRPAYPIFGSVLGLWIAYPVLIVSTQYSHPAGYIIAFSVPLLVGYIIWTDISPIFSFLDPRSRRIGILSAGFFALFYLFSSGLLTLNPEQGINVPNNSFFVITEFAYPLVLWPAIEFYIASIPLFGAISVGTLLTLIILTGLVGLNTALATTIWQYNIDITRSYGILGGVATTGATACCCCAPAIYGIISAAVGVSASPLYWIFLDPASPIGSIFFVGATVLMTASCVQLGSSIRDSDVCSISS